mmetsp:Transcript_71251/g.230732  ORF Transcript_71251/g.230732 Transcript_71251/m.230732 type:complete len:714 (-) Transcript_71251:57-2198(-)
MALRALALLALAGSPAVLALQLTGLDQAEEDGRERPGWPQYPGRQVEQLQHRWRFCFIPGTKRLTVRKGAAPPECPDRLDQEVSVPSVMHNPPPGEVAPQGTGIYTLRFPMASGRPGLLQFHGCGFSCRVFVDDQLLVDHKSGGYSVFWVEVPAADPRERKLTVMAERLWDPSVAPLYVMMTPQDAQQGHNMKRMAGGDMSHWGGLHRSVFLHTLSNAPLYIEQASALPQRSLQHITLRLKVRSQPRAGDGPDADAEPPLHLKHHVQLQLRWDGKGPKETVTALAEDYAHGVLKLKDLLVPNAQPWSTTSPHLHTVEVQLANSSDAVLLRFGLRSIAATKDGLLLNDKRIFLKGVNRHSTTPASGSALTMQDNLKDMELLQELGVNFVRGAHYQQDQRFLDLCDERGILVWEEPLQWGNSRLRLQDKTYRHEMLHGVKEMLDASANHPSVIIWGLYNEGPVHGANASCDAYQELADKIRERDSTRLLSWANNFLYGLATGGADRCEGPVGSDLIALNTYPGWYGEQDLTNESLGRQWRSVVKMARRDSPNKPVIVSEFGAEGVWELTGAAGQGGLPYSQEYQAKLLELSIGVLSKIADGVVVWQFSDIRASDMNTDLSKWTPGASRMETALSLSLQSLLHRKRWHSREPRCLNPRGSFPGPVDCGLVQFPKNCSAWLYHRTMRPKGMNNKGLVDFWRRKKLAFKVVHDAYAKI